MFGFQFPVSLAEKTERHLASAKEWWLFPKQWTTRIHAVPAQGEGCSYHLLCMTVALTSSKYLPASITSSLVFTSSLHTYTLKVNRTLEFKMCWAQTLATHRHNYLANDSRSDWMNKSILQAAVHIYYLLCVSYYVRCPPCKLTIIIHSYFWTQRGWLVE